MRAALSCLLLSLAAIAHGAPAGAPANAPAGATGFCGDGDFTMRPERKGACKGRQGVKAWWGPPSEAGVGASAPAASQPRR